MHMKAIVYHQYGGPDNLSLADVPKPVPKDNEVLVKVYAASINSWDWDMIIGKPFLVKVLTGFSKPRKPIIGSDIAGIVEQVGKDVKYFKPGDEVFGDISGYGFGAFAEYVSVHEKALAFKSPNVSFEDTAALPQAGLLAIQALRDKGHIKNGDNVLINGAGGSVGTLAVQYAKSKKTTVTCVDIAEKSDMLHELGADYFIDYRKEDYTAGTNQYDLVLDVIAHRTVADYKRALTAKGRFVMIGGSMGSLLAQMMFIQPLLNKFRSKQLGIHGFKPNRNDLNMLMQLCENGTLRPVIDSVYPLSKTAEAFHRFGSGQFKGKIIIKVSEA